MAEVSVKQLGVSFGHLQVLKDLNLEVSAGEFIVLLGPSGCGKSTLLNAIAGLLDINAGQIWIDGKNVTWEEPKDRGIGMVFQSYALYPRIQGSLADFVARQVAAVRPRRLFLSHHDDWLPGFSVATEMEPLRAAIAAASPGTELLEPGYLAGTEVFSDG